LDKKYLVLFPIPEPHRRWLMDLMDEISRLTGMAPPYEKIVPHVTLHKPLTGIDERVAIDLTRSAALQVRQTRVNVAGFSAFGHHYIVLPVHATRAVAHLWVSLGELFSKLPEYVHGPYDLDNTLHITVAEKVGGVFEGAWPLVRAIPYEPVEIPVSTIELYSKPLERGRWEMVESYPLR